MSNSIPKLISVIIPVYNVESYVGDCLESIIHQSYSNLEIIIVNDGSTDNSGLICQEYAERDSRIKHLESSNKGVSYARNRGLEVASGDYISFVDSDDCLALNSYEKLIEGFNIEGEEPIYVVDGLIYQFKDRDIDNKWLLNNDIWYRETPRFVKGQDYIMALLTNSSDHYVWSKLYKREIFDHQISFREGRLDEDTLFTYELGKLMRDMHWSMAELPVEMYYYRIRPQSICNNTTRPLRVDRIENLEWILNDGKESMPEIIIPVNKLQIRTLLWFMDEIFLTKNWTRKYAFKYIGKIRGTKNTLAKECLSVEKYKAYLLTKYLPIFRFLELRILKCFNIR